MKNDILVHRFRNNPTQNLPISPIAQIKKPRRSPLRLRFLTCTLEEIFGVLSRVIYEPMAEAGRPCRIGSGIRGLVEQIRNCGVNGKDFAGRKSLVFISMTWAY